MARRSSGRPVGRRPDLAYPNLTCANSDTPVPYVDLVNEILESYVWNFVVKNQAPLPASSNNTSSDATADQLSVNPEYTRSVVYSVPSGPLVTAIFPFNLPYDRFLDTARIYLDFLGSTRYELMQSFGVFPPTQDDQAAMMAVEYLNLDETEYELITGWSFQLGAPAPPQYNCPRLTPTPLWIFRYACNTAEFWPHTSNSSMGPQAGAGA
jgi:hypothetical protein